MQLGETTKVTVNIRRSDLIKLSAYMLLRVRSNLIFALVIAAGIFVCLVATVRSTDMRSWLIITTASIAGGVAGLLASFLISLTWILISSSEKNGTLGIHVFTLSKRGLHESTRATEGLQKWLGIQSMQKSGSFIYIRINSYLFHLIPRRAFATERDFEEFWQKAHGYWKKAT
jgi:hypothetical protein